MDDDDDDDDRGKCTDNTAHASSSVNPRDASRGSIGAGHMPFAPAVTKSKSNVPTDAANEQHAPIASNVEPYSQSGPTTRVRGPHAPCAASARAQTPAAFNQRHAAPTAAGASPDNEAHMSRFMSVPESAGGVRDTPVLCSSNGADVGSSSLNMQHTTNFHSRKPQFAHEIHSTSRNETSSTPIKVPQFHFSTAHRTPSESTVPSMGTDQQPPRSQPFQHPFTSAPVKQQTPNTAGTLLQRNTPIVSSNTASNSSQHPVPRVPVVNNESLGSLNQYSQSPATKCQIAIQDDDASSSTSSEVNAQSVTSESVPNVSSHHLGTSSASRSHEPMMRNQPSTTTHTPMVLRSSDSVFEVKSRTSAASSSVSHTIQSVGARTYPSFPHISPPSAGHAPMVPRQTEHTAPQMLSHPPSSQSLFNRPLQTPGVHQAPPAPTKQTRPRPRCRGRPPPEALARMSAAKSRSLNTKGDNTSSGPSMNSINATSVIVESRRNVTMVSTGDAKMRKKQAETEAHLYRAEKKSKWLEQQLRTAQEENTYVFFR